MDNRLDWIYSRRSIRRYEEKDVDPQIIRELLEAAMAAPSAVGKDPWHFMVVKNRETLETIADGLPNGTMLADAPLGVVVCGDIERAHSNLESYMIQDCAAAIENLLLAANALSLGACWLGVHPRPERIAHIRSIFNLPEHIVPIAGIALGYPAEVKESRTRYNADAVHYERW